MSRKIPVYVHLNNTKQMDKNRTLVRMWSNYKAAVADGALSDFTVTEVKVISSVER